MTGTPYPVVIAAIKEWIGGHKTTPAQSIEVEGQPVMRKSGWGDYLSAAISDLIGLAVSGGMALLAGGTAFDEFFAKLPSPLQGAINGLQEGVGKIAGMIPNDVTNAFTSFKEMFVNPLTNTLTSFRDGLTGSATVAGTASLWAGDNSTISTNLSAAQIALNAGGFIHDSIVNLGHWTNELTIGVQADGETAAGFKLTDAYEVVNSAPGKVLSLLNITNTPSLDEMVGSLTRNNLHDTFQAALVNHDAKLLSLKNLLTPPTIETISDGHGGTTTRNIYTPPSDAAQTAYNEWEASYNTLKESATAINDQVALDKATIASTIKEQQALQQIATLGAVQNSITDPTQLALYKSTLSADAKTYANIASSLLTSTNNATITVVAPLESNPDIIR